MAKKQLTEEEKKALEMEKKGEKLIHLEAVNKLLAEQVSDLKDEFRPFVDVHHTKVDKKKRKIWQKGVVIVVSTPNPQYEINKDLFIAKVGLATAAKYMNIDRQQVLAGIKAKELSLTEADLKQIETVGYGKPKIDARFVDEKAMKFLESLEKEE